MKSTSTTPSTERVHGKKEARPDGSNPLKANTLLDAKSLNIRAQQYP
jgi:hypothetical protein